MTDYQTKQKHRNIVVGLFVMFAFIVFAGFLWRFRDLPLLVSKVKSFEILVYFPEVPGVQKDTPIQYCGYQIGRVLKKSPPQLRGDSHAVGVTIAIDNKFSDIPDDVQITVMKRGLGSSYIEIKDVSDDAPTGYLADEMVLDGTVSMASDFFPPEVQAALPNLVDAITNLTGNINAVIGDSDNQSNIKKTLTNIEKAAAQLNESLESVERFSEQGTETVRQLGSSITRVTEELENTLSETRQIIAKIGSGEGTAGKLVNDGRLYENLLESSQELKMLVEQLKEWAGQAKEEGLEVKTNIF